MLATSGKSWNLLVLSRSSQRALREDKPVGKCLELLKPCVDPQPIGAEESFFAPPYLHALTGPAVVRSGLAGQLVVVQGLQRIYGREPLESIPGTKELG